MNDCPGVCIGVINRYLVGGQAMLENLVLNSGE